MPLVGRRPAWALFVILFGVAGMALLLLLATVREPARQQPADARDGAEGFAGYLRGNGAVLAATLGCHVLVSLIPLAFSPWAPAMLSRRLGMTPAEAGLFFGAAILVTSSAGTLVGGAAGDRLARRHPAGRSLLVTICAPLILPGMAAATLSLDRWIVGAGLVVMLASGTIITSTAYAAVQDLAPPRLQGRTLGLYAGSAQLIGLGAGPPLVAAATTYLYRDPMKVHMSNLTVVLTPWLVLVACAWFGRPGFARLRRQTAAFLTTKGLAP